MEEKELTLKQYFSVITKCWKAFLIVILCSIIVVSAMLVVVNKISAKSQSITFSLQSNIDKTAYLNSTKKDSAKKAISEFYNGDISKFDNALVEKIASSISISSTVSKTDNSYSISLSPINGLSESENNSIFKNYINSIDKTLTEQAKNSTKLVSYTIENDVKYSAYNSENELIQNLIEFRNSTLKLSTVLDKITTENTEENSIMTFSDINGNSVLSIKNELLNTVVGTIDIKNTLEYLTYETILNCYCENNSNYIDYMNSLQAKDDYDIKTLLDEFSKLSIIDNPDLYNNYKKQLDNLKSEMYIYQNNQAKYSLYTHQSNTQTQIPADMVNTINSLINKFNGIVDDYIDFIENYENSYPSEISTKSAITQSQKFSKKKILLIDIVVAIVAFVILYFIEFLILKKKGFFFDTNKSKKEIK